MTYVERQVLEASRYVLHFNGRLSGDYLTEIVATNCTFSKGLALYKDTNHSIAYSYVVIKGALSSTLTLEDINNGTDRRTNFKIITPFR